MSTEHTAGFEPPRADVIEHAQAAHSDLDTQLIAFFKEFRRVDLIYGAYGRRSGLSFSVYLIFDYICENDGTSQREICAYTLLPRQTVNNVINSLVAQGLLRLQGSNRDKRIKRIHLTEEGGALPGAHDCTVASGRSACDVHTRTRRTPCNDCLCRQVHERIGTANRRH